MKKIPTILTQGEFLQIIRKRKDQTVLEVARTIRVQQWIYKAFELDNKTIEVDSLIRLFLEIPVSHLKKFHETGEYELEITNGERLKLWLRRKKIVHKDFAKKIGYTHSALSYWLRGVYIPDPRAQEKIERVTKGFVLRMFWQDQKLPEINT